MKSVTLGTLAMAALYGCILIPPKPGSEIRTPEPLPIPEVRASGDLVIGYANTVNSYQGGSIFTAKERAEIKSVALAFLKKK